MQTNETINYTNKHRYANPPHTAKCLWIFQKFAEYNKEDSPACCWQQISQEGNVMISLIYYQCKAQPAPSI